MADKHLWEDVSAMLIAFGITGGVALLGFFLARNLGFFSYTGLTPTEVERVMQEADSKLQILSRVHGKSPFGSEFWRGVYLTNGGSPLYYKYETFDNGNANFELYPMTYEAWMTGPDWLGTSGDMIYPLTSS